ncbi:MAG: hypothetical protein U0M06_02205 [Clostridia bacterium]|nr:hypothetical protein [Clostridia bacterium]
MAYPNYYQGGYYPQYQNGAVPDMLGQYKGQYHQMPMQQPVQQMPMQPAPTNDMIFVLNETEATAYPVAPNNSVTLWDKNNDVVYIKSVNMQGVPSMRVLDYKERTADNAPKSPTEHKCQCGDKFVFKKDFQSLQSEFEALRNELEELKAKPKAKTAKKSVEEVEDNE